MNTRTRNAASRVTPIGCTWSTPRTLSTRLCKLYTIEEIPCLVNVNPYVVSSRNHVVCVEGMTAVGRFSVVETSGRCSASGCYNSRVFVFSLPRAVVVCTLFFFVAVVGARSTPPRTEMCRHFGIFFKTQRLLVAGHPFNCNSCYHDNTRREQQL